MSTEYSVQNLREATSRVLEDLDLDQVYMVNCHIDTRAHLSNRELKSAYTVRTKIDRNESGDVFAWAKYVVFALGDDGTGDLPDDAGDLTEALIEETFAWRVETEWIAKYSGPPDAVSAHSTEDLSAFALLMAPPTLHPYVRDLVQSLTGRSQHAAFTLGLLTPISAMPDDEVVDIFSENELDDSGEPTPGG